MRTLARATAVAAVTLAATATTAAAQSTIFTAILLGANERPNPVATPAVGFSTLSYDLATNTFIISSTFTGLTSPATVAHIHQPLPGQEVGPPIFDLTDVLTKATSGVTAPKSGIFTDAQEMQLFAGNLYVNIHSVNYPDGEIRGQLLYQSGPQLNVVPEPGSVLLVSTGLLAIAGVARRRRAVQTA